MDCSSCRSDQYDLLDLCNVLRLGVLLPTGVGDLWNLSCREMGVWE